LRGKEVPQLNAQGQVVDEREIDPAAEVVRYLIPIAEVASGKAV
jgi:hypothetical protein